MGEIFWRSNRSESEKQVIKVVYHERFNIRTSENDIAVMKVLRTLKQIISKNNNRYFSLTQTFCHGHNIFTILL